MQLDGYLTIREGQPTKCKLLKEDFFLDMDIITDLTKLVIFVNQIFKMAKLKSNEINVLLFWTL